MNIRKLDEADMQYALFAWRESAKKAPEYDRVPWSYYKDAIVPTFQKLLETGVVLGAYNDAGALVGWLAMTPGKRVHTVHWCHVKHELDDTRMRRRGVMLALLDAALDSPVAGARFVYTSRARRLTRDEREKQPVLAHAKTLDDLLVAALREKGVTATYVSLKEYLK